LYEREYHPFYFEIIRKQSSKQEDRPDKLDQVTNSKHEFYPFPIDLFEGFIGVNPIGTEPINSSIMNGVF
jgi:hypothetical protein